MTSELEQAKREYFLRKTIYEQLHALAFERNKILDEQLERGEISEDEWAKSTVENDFDCGVDAAQDDLIRAEDKLLLAGKGFLQKAATINQQKEIDVVCSCNLLNIRQKALMLMLKIKELH